MTTREQVCPCCGQPLSNIPLIWSFPAPYENPQEGRQYDVLIDNELFVLDDNTFFIRALLNVPIIGVDDFLRFNLWSTLSQENFANTFQLWFTEKREKMIGPMPSWLFSEIPGYESPQPVGAYLITMPVGERPVLEITYPEEHPLMIDQRDGIALERGHSIVKSILGNL